MENLVGNSVGNLAGNAVGNSLGNAVGNSMGQGGGGKAYLTKTVIWGNLAFGMGDGELTNQHPTHPILQEIFHTYLKTNF